MLELLSYFECWRIVEVVSASQEAEWLNSLLQISPVASPLRRLLAEETMLEVYAKNLAKDDLMGSDGTPGLSGSFLSASYEYAKNDQSFRRNSEYPKKSLEAWKGYLVGHLPMTHWIHDRLGKVRLNWKGA